MEAWDVSALCGRTDNEAGVSCVAPFLCETLHNYLPYLAELVRGGGACPRNTCVAGIQIGHWPSQSHLSFSPRNRLSNYVAF
jgi:hypothetical protein